VVLAIRVLVRMGILSGIVPFNLVAVVVSCKREWIVSLSSP
jgi:hypothetical protein